MNKEMMEEMYKSADFYEKHKQEYEEVNADSDSILKIYKRKDSKKKWYKYDTFYMFDNELLEKKCNDFVKGFKDGKTTYEDSVMNMGLILSELANRNDDFSLIAKDMYNNMFNNFSGVK